MSFSLPSGPADPVSAPASVRRSVVAAGPRGPRQRPPALTGANGVITGLERRQCSPHGAARSGAWLRAGRRTRAALCARHDTGWTI